MVKRNVDGDSQSLRGFLRLVETEYPDELLRVREPIDLRFDAAALVFELDHAGKSPVVVFENVRGNRLGSAGKCLRIRLSCLRNDRLTDFTTLTLSNRAPALETGLDVQASRSARAASSSLV